MNRKLTALAALALAGAGLAAAGTPAMAAGSVTVTCPSVGGLGLVTPAPTPGVDWAGCDLLGADLDGADLTNANLSDATLSGAYLSGATLTGADLAGATLIDVESGQVIGTPADLPANWTMLDGYLAGPDANLVRADFAGQDLSGLDLFGASLEQVNLNGANLSGTDLAEADLTGVTSGGVIASPAPTLPTRWTLQGGYLLGPEASLDGADMTSMNLSGLDLYGTSLRDANLSGLDLSGTDLARANLTGASINGVQFAGANIGATTFGAINGTPASLPPDFIIVTVPASSSTPGNYVVGPDASLTGVDFSGQDLSNVDMVGAFLDQDNLSGANFTGADLAGINLQGANLDSANLTNANVESASLEDADFAGSILSGTILAGSPPVGAKSGSITGTPASLPTGWVLVHGYLVGEGANLAGADLSGMSLSEMGLDQVILTDANLTNTDLAGSALSNADFTGADLAGADLAGAQLTQANLTSANATGTNFTNAEFSETTVSGLVMAGAIFTGASITGPYGPSAPGLGLEYASPGTGTPAALPAKYAAVDGYLVGPYDGINDASLTGANLSKDDLDAASITNSNLSSANLDGANLDAADLEGDTVTGATAVGATWLNTTCPDGSNSNKHVDGCFTGLDTTPPVVTITGIPVPNRNVYVLGHVPTPSCKTTDNGTLEMPATISIKTVASRGAGAGVGLFTITCSGANDLAGNEAAPVSESYTNVYGMTGFLSLANGATFSRTTRVITVHFRLTNSSGKAIPASTAKAFATDREVHITLAGPGIRASSNTCAWDAAQQVIACAIHVPATGIRTGSSQRYTITATENVSTTFQTIPAVARTVDPQIIHFR